MVYGKGQGRGPGELINPTDFSESETGALWVADPGTGLISIFGMKGSLVRTIRPGKPPYRLALLQEEKFFVMYSITRENLFALCRQDGSEIRSFGNLIDEQIKHGLVLDGYIAPTGDGGLIYAGNRAGILASYSNGGELRFYVETIERIPFPKLLRRNVDGVVVTQFDPSTPWTTLSLSVVDREIFLLSGSRSELAQNSIFDVYSLTDL